MTNSDGGISQYDMAANGTLDPETPALVSPGVVVSALAFMRDGRSVYFTELPMNKVRQYSTASGTLSTKSPATVPAGDNPVGIATATPPQPPQLREPDNEFTFGKVKKNKRKGTTNLTVNVPGPGALELAKASKVKRAEKPAEGEGSVKLPIKSKGTPARSSRRAGRR